MVHTTKEAFIPKLNDFYLMEYPASVREDPVYELTSIETRMGKEIYFGFKSIIVQLKNKNFSMCYTQEHVNNFGNIIMRKHCL